MSRYKNKFRVESARLKNWNYAWSGVYFITICTKEREYYFGEIHNGKMQLSEIGKIAEKEWIRTFDIRPDMNLKMCEYVIMPNHIHGIIVIGDNEYNKQGDKQCRDTMHRVSTNINTKFGPQSKNLASIIRGYKSSVTTYACKNGIDGFKWQSRFYDHLIRNERSFDKISDYIVNNPKNWENDELNINNSNYNNEIYQ